MTERSPFDDHIRPPEDPPAPRWPDPVPHAPAMSIRSPQSGRRGRGRFVRSVIIAAAAVAVVAVGVQYLSHTTRQPPVNVTTVVHRVNPGLVDVNSNLGFNQGGAAGTGMVISPTGEVLTNNHVVDGATSVQVVDVGNGRTYTASVVGTDRTDDIAVLQIQGASNLATVNLGSASGLSVGDAVAAFGNAGGIGGTPSVASGHVTGLGQSITAFDDVTNSSESLTGLIQTDAAIQPGDSGGPLVNSVGTVVGMDTAASAGSRGQSGSSTNGFAIPIDKVLSIAQQIEHGTSSGTVHIGPVAFIGVEISATQASQTPGVVISDVIPGEPADTVGLKSEDAITSIDGVAVTSPSQLTHQMQRLHPGQTVWLAWTDTTGQAHKAQITLASGPAA
jgi:S1-C subfamily serine protease